MSAQIIEREGKPEYAVVPYNEYLELLALAEDAQDAADASAAMKELAIGEDETVPGDIAERLITGKEHPVKIWREYRGLTHKASTRRVPVPNQAMSIISSKTDYAADAFSLCVCPCSCAG